MSDNVKAPKRPLTPSKPDGVFAQALVKAGIVDEVGRAIPTIRRAKPNRRPRSPKQKQRILESRSQQHTDIE